LAPKYVPLYILGSTDLDQEFAAKNMSPHALPLIFKDLLNWIKSLAPKYGLAPPPLHFRICQAGSRVLAPKYVPLYIVGSTDPDQEFGPKHMSLLLPLYILVSADLDQEFSTKICLGVSPLTF
jgi:hypothetical protein